MDISEFSLLFPNLVILNEDIDTKETQSTEENKSPVKNMEPSSMVESEQLESQDLKIKNLKYLVLSGEEQINRLIDPKSNFIKIIHSLDLSHLQNELTNIESISNINQISDKTSIWCIGLSPDQIASLPLKNKKLISTDPEQSMSKQEKLALYNPLKEFVSYLK